MKQIRSLDCKQGAVRAVRYNVDGGYCLTCGSDKILKLWNPKKGLLLNRYEGHRSDIMDAAASGDATQLVSGSMDKNVLLWDVAEAQVIRSFRGHEAQINAVKFNEEGSVALSASFDGTLRCWDTKSRSRDPLQIMDEAKDSVTSIVVSKNEIITGSLDGKVRCYDLRQGILHVDDVKAPVGNVALTRDGQCILASCINSSLRLVDRDSGEILAEFTGHKNTDYRIDGCLLKNDAVVLSGSEDGNVYAWNLTQGTLIEKMPHVKHRVVHSLSPHPTRDELLTAAENYIYLWSSEVDPDEDVDQY